MAGLIVPALELTCHSFHTTAVIQQKRREKAITAAIKVYFFYIDFSDNITILSVGSCQTDATSSYNSIFP